MRERKFRGKLKLNVPEWGHFKKGDVETFWFNLLHDTTGLVRYPIDNHWDIIEWDDYIGQKDIHGESLYENDRVSFTTIKEFDGSEGKRSTGVIKWDEEDTGFFIENDDWGYPHVKLWFATKIEIIKE